MKQTEVIEEIYKLAKQYFPEIGGGIACNSDGERIVFDPDKFFKEDTKHFLDKLEQQAISNTLDKVRTGVKSKKNGNIVPMSHAGYRIVQNDTLDGVLELLNQLSNKKGMNMKTNLLSNCCASDFDPLGYEKEYGVWQERCDECGKLCEALLVSDMDVKNIKRCIKWNKSVRLINSQEETGKQTMKLITPSMRAVLTKMFPQRHRTYSQHDIERALEAIIPIAVDEHITGDAEEEPLEECFCYILERDGLNEKIYHSIICEGKKIYKKLVKPTTPKKIERLEIPTSDLTGIRVDWENRGKINELVDAHNAN